MLGKLMKYDLRSCLRKFGPLWLAAMALSALTGLFFRFANSSDKGPGVIMAILTATLPTVLIGLFIVIAVLAFVFICGRFYKGLLGDEGYLMMTLPASVEAHIASKWLTALILEIITAIISLISISLLLVVFNPDGLQEGLADLIMALKAFDFPTATPWLIAEVLLIYIVGAAVSTMHIYMAISLGHLARRHRILWAVLAYIGVNTALNMLVGFGLSSNLLSNAFDRSFDFFFDFGSGMLTNSGAAFIAGTMGAMLLWEALLGTAFFFVTRYILKKHLNLE